MEIECDQGRTRKVRGGHRGYGGLAWEEWTWIEEKAWVEAGLKRRSRDGRVGKDGVKASHVTVVACNGRGA